MTFWNSNNLKGGFMLPEYVFKKDIDNNYYNLPQPPIEENNVPSTIGKIFIGYSKLFNLLLSKTKLSLSPRPASPPLPPSLPPPRPASPPPLLSSRENKEIKYGEKGCNNDDCSKCNPIIPNSLICEQGKKLKKGNSSSKSKNFDDDILKAVLNPKLKKIDTKWEEEKNLRNRAREVCNTEGNKNANFKDCCKNSKGCINCDGPLNELKCKKYDINNDILFKEKYLKYKSKYIYFKNFKSN